jgi:uncharacterized protein YjbJ (UPF0337 family)
MKNHDRDRDVGRELGNELEGGARQVKGKIKEETGDLLNDRSTEFEGKVEKNLGKAQRGLSNPTDSMSRDWDEDISGEGSADRGSDIGNRDRSGSMGRDHTTGSGSDRSSGSGRGSDSGSDRSGDKGRSGY